MAAAFLNSRRFSTCCALRPDGVKKELTVQQFLLLILPGRIAQFILSLVVLRVATQVLSPAEMGRMSLVISTIAFFTVLLIYPVGTFINRRLHTWHESGQVAHYFSRYWKYLFVVSMAVALVLTMNQTVGIVDLQTDILWLLVLVCGSMLFNTANQTVISSLNLLDFKGWFIGLTLLTVAVGFLFSLFFVRHYEPKAEYWLFGQIVGQLLLAIWGAKILSGKVRSSSSRVNISWGQIIALLAFAWPVTVSVGLNWMQTQGYRFLMENQAGLVSLGLFFAGYGVSAGLISAIETILATYFQPKFYKQISSDNHLEQSAAWNEYAQIMLPALLLTGIFVAILAQEIAYLLLAPAFWPASAFIVWGACAETLRAAAGVFGLIAHAKMNTKMLLFPHTVGAVTAIGLAWYLLPAMGAAGVGAALVAAGIGTLIPMVLVARTQIRISLAPSRLLWSFGLGAVIFFLAAGIRLLLGENHTILAILPMLILLGLLFGAFQLAMLRPFFDKIKGMH